MPDQLCLLTVHAHPDDESSKGAGTVARYHAEGVRTVLVTCTGGEEGEILNPVMDTETVRANLTEVRRQELQKAAGIIGYDEVVMLGYRDSGMPDSPANEDPRSFHQAPLEEAVERLVRIIRQFRPQVIITYGPDQGTYRHPDHLKVYEISALAFDLAGVDGSFPNAGEPFQPLKLYYTMWLHSRMVRRHEKFLELGLKSPYDERMQQGSARRARPDTLATTTVDLTGFEQVRFDALRAHATQVDPASLHWFGLPMEIEHEIHSSESFELGRNLVGPLEDEDDLFAGIREPARRS